MHYPHGFSIALRPRHTKIAVNVLLGVTALLVTDKGNTLTFKTTNPAYYCWIITKQAIAMQFINVFQNPVNIIQRIWSSRMTRKLRSGGQGSRTATGYDTSTAEVL